jgi:hypothetical protein
MFLPNNLARRRALTSGIKDAFYVNCGFAGEQIVNGGIVNPGKTISYEL